MNIRSKSLRNLCALLLITCTSSSSWAQEEPIAVASPVKEPVATATPVAAASSIAADKDAGKKLRPLTVSAQLMRSDLVITGALTESTQLNLKTAFGEASIPLSEVAGVRFPSGQDTSTTLVMLNGDSITGASDVKNVTIETEWGVAKINGENLSSMMFVPGLEWQSINGLNGSRWTLTEAKAKPTGNAGSTLSGTASANSNGNGQSGVGQSGGVVQASGLIPVNGTGPQGGLSSPNNNTPRVVFPRQ